jgi:hypothetical protein
MEIAVFMLDRLTLAAVRRCCTLASDALAGLEMNTAQDDYFCPRCRSSASEIARYCWKLAGSAASSTMKCHEGRVSTIEDAGTSWAGRSAVPRVYNAHKTCIVRHMITNKEYMFWKRESGSLIDSTKP